MPLIHVIPARLGDDLFARVRDPATGQPVPPDGLTVEWSTYWQRRWDDAEIEAEGRPRTSSEEADEVAPPPPFLPVKDARPRRAHYQTPPAAPAGKED